MKKYFYAEGDEHIGPFTIEELKEKKISRETLVWCDGMVDWEKAKNVEEIKSIFAVIPPPIKKETPPPIKKEVEATPPTVHKTETVVNTNTPVTEVKKAKSNKTRNILIIVFAIIIVAVAAILITNYYINKDDDSSSSSSSSSSSNSSNSDNNTYQEQSTQKSEQELKADLKGTEESNPTKYLSVSGKGNFNLLNQTVIEGNISNTATLATFKDIKVKVTFQTKTGTVLNTNSFIVYDFASPGKNIHYKTKLAYYNKNCKALSLDVVSATPAR